MSTDTLVQIGTTAAAVLLVALNGFFVLAEFALVKVRATRMRELAEKGNRNAGHALAIVGRMDAYLSTCQLGITIASLGLGWLGEPAFARLLEPILLKFGPWKPAVSHSIAFAVAFAFITLVHVVIGELAPKSVAIRKTEWAALFSARPLRAFHFLFFPAMWILNTSSNFILRLIGLPGAGDVELAHTESELKMIIGASRDQGAFTLSRLLMMENVIDFGTMTAADVMLPLSKVAMLDPKKPWPENREIIETSLHSRFPLAGERVEKQVHVKDILLQLARGGTVDLGAIARPAPRVPVTMPLEELLKRFHSNVPHLALVEDAGKLVGIVTMEDVLEELVGTIRDEFEQVKDYRLSELVPSEAVFVGLEHENKEALIRRMIGGLASARKDVDAGKAAAAVLKREGLASTGLGMGVAIPHGRVEGMSRPAAAIGRAREGGLDFASIDGKPVNMIFLILSPPHDEGAHLHILEKISNLLLSDYLREKLAAAKTPDEVLAVLKESDLSIPA
jgi:CBS domain containing-hemolysin-like protein